MISDKPAVCAAFPPANISIRIVFLFNRFAVHLMMPLTTQIIVYIYIKTYSKLDLPWNMTVVYTYLKS